MTVLIAFASKHGATKGIAERIGETLRDMDLAVDVRRIDDGIDVDQYDAFVIGSAVYFGSWRKEAVRFLEQHAGLLAGKPVWLFSSGPVGDGEHEPDGADPLEAAEPKQIASFRTLVHPNDHRVFFGALDRSTFGIGERLLSALPAGKKLFVEGDFRDWDDIAAWASSIGEAMLQPNAAG